MKTVIITIIAALSSVLSFAQTFSVTADTIEGNYSISEYPSDYNYVVNNSDTTLILRFDLLTNTIPSNGWSVTLCTHQFCMPSVPTTGSFGVLAPGDQGYFNVHVGFNQKPGTGEISFRIYEYDNPSNADTIHFIYHASTTVGIAENLNLPVISIYPNPTTNIINIKGLNHVEETSYSIYSLSGTLITSGYLNQSGQNINVSTLSIGSYLLKIYEGDNTIHTKKFIKQ